jgi:hypothetical protein
MSLHILTDLCARVQYSTKMQYDTRHVSRFHPAYSGIQTIFIRLVSLLLELLVLAIPPWFRHSYSANIPP